MNVIIMGCGRVGEQLARLMADGGHAVTVIDYAQAALDRLDPGFNGRTILGVGFDRNVLIRAGIEQAEAFAATSSSDNANIVAAQIARRIFRVPRVVARVYNPRQVEVYQRLGLVTISSTTWGAERIHELLTHSDLDAVMSFGSGEVSLVAIEAPPRLVGRIAKDITVAGEISVVAVVREGKALLPTLGTEFRARDVIHLAVLATAMERVEALLGQ